jgi:hypothetical protein
MALQRRKIRAIQLSYNDGVLHTACGANAAPAEVWMMMR